MVRRQRARSLFGLLAFALSATPGSAASAGEPTRAPAPHTTGGAQFMFGVGLYGRKLHLGFYAGGIGRVGVQVATRWALLAEPALFLGLGTTARNVPATYPPMGSLTPYLGLVAAYRPGDRVELSAGPAGAVEIGFPLDDPRAVSPRIGGSAQVAALASAPAKGWRFVVGLRVTAMAAERGSLVLGGLAVGGVAE